MAAPKGNLYALGNNGGRPAHYNTHEEFASAVVEYFDYCAKNNEKVTITALCLHIGFASRSTLDDYAKKSDEFSYIAKRAKLAVENSYETSGNTIDIFALKNMGWKDRTEIDNNLSGSVNVIFEATPGCDPIKNADDYDIQA